MKHGDTPSTLDALATRLASSKLPDMATGLAEDPQIQRLWTEFPDRRLYASLVPDAQRSEAVRFAAALVLLAKAREQLFQLEPRPVAQVFAIALRDDLAGYAYPWGWLWARGDGAGPLGRVFLQIGRPALPALAALLDDKTPRDSYLGSEEATEMAQRGYRVKDFAAFYTAQIVGAELPWDPDRDKRDAAIARLREALPR